MAEQTPVRADVEQLFTDYARGEVSRREFMSRCVTLGIAGAAMGAIGTIVASPSQAAAAAQATTAAAKVDLAEWSYFWVGVKQARLARGTVVNGEQMYVEYWVPAQVRHPYGIVMVHGGGSQGLDWLGTPDGRPGWVTYFLQAGFPVYVVDRPGHGRAPYLADIHGPFGQMVTYARLERQLTNPAKFGPDSAPTGTRYGPAAARHSQWPGPTGSLGDPTADQTIAGQGGAFSNDLAAMHALWAARGGELLDRIGPAVVMAHSQGGPSCWLYGDARPNLVKGLIGIEPNGPPFGALQWGVTAAPVAYDPPVKDLSELKTVEVHPSEAGRIPYRLQAEPARKLKNLRNIPIAVVTADASYHWAYDVGTVAFLRQAGCTVEHIELEKIARGGYGHMLMVEKDNGAIVRPIVDWLERAVSAPLRRVARPPMPAASGQASLRLADHGHFWVGVEHKETAYGVIASGQMYVQYLIPAEVRHQTPVVLVHGGGGQMLDYMGPGGGAAGWAHYYVQAGYKVYLVDRPGHGRSVYHPDALGPLNLAPTYENLAPDIARGAPAVRFGTGRIGDPRLDQFMAGQSGTLQDGALSEELWRTRGAALLDRIGPAVIQTHSAGGPFGWLTAAERPNLTRAVVSFEGAGVPLVGAAARPLPALKGLPMMYLTAQASRRTQGPAIVEALNRSGAVAEHVALVDRGIVGNSHFAMLEANRKDVFEVIRRWIEQKVWAA